ncbi:MAG: T9SS type A sorting domain-containing protein [Bacteroidetes bacterium]|nr:T9SS type A sorting domain-containing protein [Bacteroidota bacterium]
MKKFYVAILLLFISFTGFSQLSGIKSIPGDYATISAAITALNAAGVGAGGVTFNVAAGYTETASNLLITATGTVANPIVFQKSGAGADPLITASPGVSTTLDGILILRGTDYITFNGIDLKDPATNVTPTTQMEWGYALLKTSATDGCQNVMITNCTITLQRIYASAAGIYSANHLTTSTTALTVTAASGTNSNNKFYSNVIQNVNTGISVTGFNDVTPYSFYDQNNDIGGTSSGTGNTIQNFGGVAATTSYGVNVAYQNNGNISYNSISNMTGGGIASASIIYGIQYNTSANAAGTINNNTVMLAQGANASRIYCISSGILGTGTLTVSGNLFIPSFVAGATGNLYCIYVANAMNAITFTGNQFVNCPNLNTTGSVYFISNSTTTQNVTVTNNTINLISKPSAGGSVYGYYTVSSPGGGTETISSNTFSNIAVAGNTSFYGIYSASTSVAQNKIISFNTVLSVNGGSSPVYGIYCIAGNSVTLSGNWVSLLAGGFNGTGAGAVYAYYAGSAGTVNLAFYGNSATSNSNANTGGNYGIDIAGGTTVNCYRNVIQNMSGSVAASVLYGYYVNTGTNVNLYNNLISNLTAPVANGINAISGIYINGGTNVGVYNNSAYLDATSSAVTFGTSGIYSSTTPLLDLRNNNIVNVSTPGTTGGYTVSYRRNNTTLTTYSALSGNNNFYAGTPSATNLLFYDGTNMIQTLAACKSFLSPRDGQSVSENPPFVNVSSAPYDLHLKTIVATSCESGGVTVSVPVSIISDYDGDPRYPNGGYPDNPSYPATAPDIGADEFAGIPLDVNGPVISYSTLLNTSSTANRIITATITDISGVPTSGIGLPRLYWKINAGAWNFVTGVSIGGNQYTFTFGAGVITGDVVSYYVVAQDNDTPTPNTSASPAAGASGFTINPPAVSTPPTTPNSYTIIGSLCGTYTVGAGQTYTTLTAAVADLNIKEVTCPVIFMLKDATYGAETFPITIGPVLGSSSINTVTIRPATGVTTTLTGTSASGILILNGADYIIIDGSNSGGTDKSLTWENTNTFSNRYAIGFSSAGGTNPATNNIIQNCNIKASSQVTNNTYGIYMNPAGGGYDNTIISNNTIFSARYGIFFGGAPAAVANNGQIINNIIGSTTDATSIQFIGIILANADNTLISGNEIMGAPAGNANYYQIGISVGTGSTNTKIRKNKIHDWFYTGTGGWGNYGIYYASGASTLTEISNNLIYNIKADGYPGIQTDNPYGIYIASGGNCLIWFNTISLTGALLSTGYPGASSACISINPGITGLYIQNNIFRNSMLATSGTPADYTYAVYSSSSNAAFSGIDFNDYWVDGLGPNIGYIGAANQATLADWQVATFQDAASLSVDPAFISLTDLHPTATALGKKGVAVPSITDDFSGTLRTDPPDAGAYQFSANPVVTTTAASGVSCGSVTLNGTINANNATVTTGFEYGPTVSYGSSIAAVPATVTGSTPIAINAVVAGMTPNVVNHFRAKGTSGGSTIYGTDMTVIPPCPPAVVTTSATAITSSGATLNGTVNANNLSSTVLFEYGLTTAYGTAVPGVPSPVAGGTPTSVAAAITGLLPGITYHFRVKGTNSVGTANGNDMTFTTLAAPPTVVTTAATAITSNSATLNGTVIANGASTAVTFNYGLTAAYGFVVAAVPSPVTGNTLVNVSAGITGLACNTLYHFRVSGTNSAGTTNGNDLTFTTSGAVNPAGTITGPVSVCRGATSVIYTVPAITGATGYVWSVPTGATIVSGANTTTITVNYSLAAVSGNVTVYGTNACMNGTSSSLAVTVNILPLPTITGIASVCVNSSGNVYTTEPGMTAYTWVVSSGGSITAGSGTNSITVTWNIAGSQNIYVNYTNSNGCMASSPTVKTITVNPLPVPTITGPASVCAGTASVIYSTETGNTTYNWTVSAGGIITSGAGTAAITVTWINPGAQTVSVNYTNTNGCTGASPTVKNVTVNALPVPTLTGPGSVCAGTAGVTYYTETGMTAYTWTVSAGGVITGGGNGTSPYVVITWNTTGAQTVSVNYTNSNGCTAAAATVKNVTVNALPVPTITGTTAVCAGTSGVTYTTETGMTAYLWTISSGGTITAGSGTSSITVTWNTAGAQTVSVNYTNANGCTAATATVKNVTVNALPVPTITGPTSVCKGSTGVVYTTQPGMTGYIWTITSGGIITSGAGTNSVVVTWNTTGSQRLYVNYTNSSGCTAAVPGSIGISVNALPVPTITGPATACAGSNAYYYTETGMTGYLWGVSAGGTITSGQGTKTIMITWQTAGARTVSVNYTNTNGCTATSPTVKNVTVNPVYTPVITGVSSLCLSTQTYVYTTQTGMGNYTWRVSTGGLIISGGTTTSPTVTIRWTAAGAQWVSVNYSNAYGCSAASPTVYPVTVNPIPVPSLTGPNKVCAGTTGAVYTTQAGMSNYVWTVSPGGTITAGGTSTSNTATITWLTAGTQHVNVNYQSSAGCTATTPANLTVTVNLLPVPTLTGPTSVCAGSAGNTYTTQAGMANYTWVVSPGGTITAGGTSTKNTVTVTWNTPGAQQVSVNYTNTNGCTATAPGILGVTVNALPVPSITGPSDLCAGTAGAYMTQTGFTNYTWTVSPGGIITGGGTTTSPYIMVKWTATGAQWVRVNYTNPSGCRATAYTQFNITVNPLPVPSITGLQTVCQGTSGVVYSTQTGMTGYSWSVSSGGVIASGTGTNSITVNWVGYGAQWVKVNYANSNGCTAVLPVQFNVTVNQATVPSLNGIFTLCSGATVSYYTDAGKTNYIWTVSAGGTIVSGAGTRLVNVLWSIAGANSISVIYTTTSGCPITNPTTKTVTVNAAPVPTITGPATPCLGTTYYYSTESGMSNYTWTLGGSGGVIYSGFYSSQILVKWVTTGAKTVSVNYTAPGGCRAAVPTLINVYVVTCTDSVVSGAETRLPEASFTVYPNPNNGRFIARIQCECQDNCSLDIYNMMGVKVFEMDNLKMESKLEVPIDLQDLPQGMYTVIFRNSNQFMVRKIVINR